MPTYKPRSKSELNKDARKYLNSLLERERADLNKSELEFLEARRMYLTAEQLEHYGIKMPKIEKTSKTGAPANDETGDEDETENGEESEDAEDEDEPSEDDEESVEDAEDGTDLDPATGKPAKTPAGRAGGKKK